ncbi:MAG TPA: nucleotide exchange factor GrpE [Actinomycetales bacterium]|nr:nucleotide exchange factor GrpE [Actinomycetales bacterium]
MTQHFSNPEGEPEAARRPSAPGPGEQDNPQDQQEQGPVVRDRRRIDPETGQVRTDQQSAQQAEAGQQHGRHASPRHETEVTADGASSEADDSALGGAAAQLAAERLADLQRLQAEYVNYRKRVDRDRDVARETAIADFVESLLPVMDDIYFARQHGDLKEGPPAAIADKLEGVLSKYGVERYGEVGDEFDPTVHDALMHSHSAEVTTTTVTTVMQPGYKIGEKVLRAARVGVSDPE